MSESNLPRLRLALPKGRLTERTLDFLRGVGLPIEAEITRSRRLLHDISAATVEPLGCRLEVLLIKNTDVPVYVEHGVADIGVVGTDALYEADVEVYRPWTFPYGSCDIALAAPAGVDAGTLRRRPWLRVATKYKRYARDHFAGRGVSAEIIPLSGSVELAPTLGLADAILDLVETGQTLRENGLEVVEVVGRTEVKLIANRALSTPAAEAVERLILRLSGAAEGR